MKINQIDGTTFPEEDFVEQNKLLKGFFYREEEIIKSVEDLFKDDRKFTLASIKQLENK